MSRMYWLFSRDHQQASSANSAAVSAVGGDGGASHRSHVKRQNCIMCMYHWPPAVQYPESRIAAQVLTRRFGSSARGVSGMLHGSVDVVVTVDDATVVSSLVRARHTVIRSMPPPQAQHCRRALKSASE